MVSPSSPTIRFTVKRFELLVGDLREKGRREGGRELELGSRNEERTREAHQRVTISPRCQGFLHATCHLSRRIQSRVVYVGHSGLSVGWEENEEGEGGGRSARTTSSTGCIEGARTNTHARTLY